MFLFFKPPQSYLQVQLLDPDGFKKAYDRLEEEYAAKVLQSRQPKTKKRKRPSLEFKKQIESQLRAGAPKEQILKTLDTEALKTEVSAILAEYNAKVVAHTEMLLERARKIAFEKKKKRDRKIKALLLLTAMDD
jgi:hypothetical protein